MKQSYFFNLVLKCFKQVIFIPLLLCRLPYFLSGETNLQLSCIKNDVVKVKQLLTSGADANMKDNAGWTALHEACNHGYTGCVQELLKARQLVYEIKPGDGMCC